MLDRGTQSCGWVHVYACVCFTMMAVVVDGYALHGVQILLVCWRRGCACGSHTQLSMCVR